MYDECHTFPLLPELRWFPFQEQIHEGVCAVLGCCKVLGQDSDEFGDAIRVKDLGDVTSFGRNGLGLDDRFDSTIADDDQLGRLNISSIDFINTNIPSIQPIIWDDTF